MAEHPLNGEDDAPEPRTDEQGAQPTARLTPLKESPHTGRLSSS